ncbi:MAG TPA: hypothetical protein VHZ51_26680, partial [Ktedonobacteraceae bacterium]|nr:hypothetical protein [Ktedonobacteraceae bacterium]
LYHTRSKVLSTEIRVPVRAGQQSRLIEKLADIQQSNRHTFPGTIARYIVQGDPELTALHFFFVWKDTDMPDESLRQQSLQALQEELADVLEWEQAHTHTNEALMHT